MKLLSIFVLLAGSTSFAIPTKDCPTGLMVKVGDLRVTTTVDTILKDRLIDWEPVQVAGAKQALKSMNQALSKGIMVYELRSAKSGKCVYVQNGSSDTQHKAEIFTSRGQNQLYFQTNVGPRGILARVYANILSVRKDRVQLANTSGKVLMAMPRYPYDSYVAGGDLIPVGVANQLVVEAERMVGPRL